MFHASCHLIQYSSFITEYLAFAHNDIRHPPLLSSSSVSVPVLFNESSSPVFAMIVIHNPSSSVGSILISPSLRTTTLPTAISSGQAPRAVSHGLVRRNFPPPKPFPQPCLQA